MRLLRPFAFALALVLAGCGGGDTASSGGEDLPSTTQVEETDPREGFFGTRETSAMNGALKPYNATGLRLQDAEFHERCNTELENGSNACHIAIIQQHAAAVGGVADVLAGLNGKYRPTCESELEEAESFVRELQEAYLAVERAWAKEPQGGPTVDAAYQHAHSLDLVAEHNPFSQTLTELTEACMIAADRSDDAVEAGKKESGAQ